MELTEQQKGRLQEVGKTLGLQFIILHGSYATGKARADSDLDIAVVGRSPIGVTAHASLYHGLSEVFGDSPHRELDFKSLYHADPLFRYQVTRDGVLLYGDPRAYSQYKMFAFRDYIETADLRRLESRLTIAKQTRLAETLATHR